MQNTLMKPANTFQVSAKGIELLKSIEQLRLKPYDDQTGEEISSWVKGATVGYGHLIASAEWNKYAGGITQEQADTLFIQDLEPFINAVRSEVTAEIAQNHFDALVIFVSCRSVYLRRMNRMLSWFTRSRTVADPPFTIASGSNICPTPSVIQRGISLTRLCTPLLNAD